VRAFAARLDLALGLPMLLWDERLTTFAAAEAADAAGLRGHRRAAALDALAAAAIRQDTHEAVARSERRAPVAEPSPPAVSPRRA
jgi:putative Holliday junction resolvase